MSQNRQLPTALVSSKELKLLPSFNSLGIHGARRTGPAQRQPIAPHVCRRLPGWLEDGPAVGAGKDEACGRMGRGVRKLGRQRKRAGTETTAGGMKAPLTMPAPLLAAEQEAAKPSPAPASSSPPPCCPCAAAGCCPAAAAAACAGAGPCTAAAAASAPAPSASAAPRAARRSRCSSRGSSVVEPGGGWVSQAERSWFSSRQRCARLAAT